MFSVEEKTEIIYAYLVGWRNFEFQYGRMKAAFHRPWPNQITFDTPYVDNPIWETSNNNIPTCGRLDEKNF